MTCSESKELFKKINIEITDEQFNKFSLYENLLLEWNERINLTAITEDKEIWIKHFIDSCVINQYIKDSSKVIDVGTGAGFPGIPIKIINDSVELTLLDSLNKRISFLTTICNSLDLKNVYAIHGRAEDYANIIKYRETFDVATARAVSNLATLSEYCIPFVKAGGYFIAMKSGNIDDEIKEAQNSISILGGEVEDVIKYDLLDLGISRSIVLIKKVKKTPSKYPRKAGIPLKEPIK